VVANTSRPAPALGKMQPIAGYPAIGAPLYLALPDYQVFAALLLLLAQKWPVAAS
jgi:hypothetical protein